MKMDSYAVPVIDDSWLKVKQLKTGTELRVYKKAAKQPVSALFDEATDTNLIVVIKNEQLAIPKDDIDLANGQLIGVAAGNCRQSMLEGVAGFAPGGVEVEDGQLAGN